MKKIVKKWKLLLTLFWVTQATAVAQSSPIQLKSLEVELWPEFDRPETLVIYHVELASQVALPAEVTFRLPGYVEKMHVVAVEREGVLVEVSPNTIELQRENDELLLTFSSPAPRIQFEYYDARILTKQGTARQLKFDYVASYPVEKATFLMQEPFQTEKLAMTPAPTSTFTGNDGLTYHAVEIAGLAADETFTLTISYNRSGDALSVQNLVGPNDEHAADLAVVAEPPVNENLSLGYALIGIGVVLLLGVVGYWGWSKQAARAKARTAAPRLKRAAKSVEVAAPAADPISNFCYRCGTALREDANFCHSCGAERRRE